MVNGNTENGIFRGEICWFSVAVAVVPIAGIAGLITGLIDLDWDRGIEFPTNSGRYPHSVGRQKIVAFLVSHAVYTVLLVIGL